MPYTNKGFTGNDGSEGSGWDPVEVQHFQDIENTIVGSAIGGVKDTSGHKHGALYDPSKVMVVQVNGADVEISTGYQLTVFDGFNARKAANLNGIVSFVGPYINSSTGGPATVDLNAYNAISWRPSTTSVSDLTVTLTNATQGMVLPISIRGGAAGSHRLVVAGIALLQYAGRAYSEWLYYDGGVWSHMQGQNA
jgi:hypothetical protein